MKGLASQTLNWITHASNSDVPVIDWLAFLALILIVSFLWSTVVKAQIQ